MKRFWSQRRVQRFIVLAAAEGPFDIEWLTDQGLAWAQARRALAELVHNGALLEDCGVYIGNHHLGEKA